LIVALQKNPYDTSNFDADFTGMTPRFTPIPQQAMGGVNQAEFRGFSFVNNQYKHYASSSSNDLVKQDDLVKETDTTDL